MRNVTQEGDWKTNLLGKTVEKKNEKHGVWTRSWSLLKSRLDILANVFFNLQRCEYFFIYFLSISGLCQLYEYQIVDAEGFPHWHQKGFKHILSTCYFAFQI